MILEPFDGSNFGDYVDRLDSFFLANEVAQVAHDADEATKAAADKNKSADLVTLLGKSGFSTLKDLCLPDKPLSKSYTELCKLLQTHYDPKASVAAESYRFHQATQGAETAKDFANILKRLAVNCQFGDYLQRALRDQFVRGLRSRATTKKLLAEDKSFAEAVAIAIADELAETDADTLSHTPLATSSVHQVSETRPNRPKETHKASSSRRVCWGCGGQWHAKRELCPAWGKSCQFCKKLNHFEKVCRAKSVNLVDDEDADGDDQGVYNLYHTSTSKPSIGPYMCTVRACGKPLVMEVDTGAAVTIINESTYAKLPPQELPLYTDDLPKLRSFAGKIITPIGSFTTEVTHGKSSAMLTMYVVKGDRPNLLGRDSLEKLQLDWTVVFRVSQDSDTILDNYPDLFKQGLGTWNHGSVKLAVDCKAKPCFLKARSVPYALQAKVEAELDRLVTEKIIQPVEFSEWAAPIVPVLKSNGHIRICGDYKCTVNQAAKVDKYPLPNIEDLYVKLTNGRHFSKLDLSNAYQQLILDEESKPLTTINTSKGLFVYNRLPFGVSSAPGIFQRTMEQLLAGMPMVVVYLDDILVCGRTLQEHDEVLKQVLDRLQSAGLRLNREKCLLSQPSVTFLGHRIDATGIHPTAEKVQDVTNAPVPTNVAELRSYLGLINYYHKFLCNLSSILAPLYELLSTKSWQWSSTQQAAFDKSKVLLSSAPVRVHYDPKLPLVVSCDASPYGIGAVLSHLMQDGSEHPVVFASRTLSPAEKKYAQIDREGPAMVFAVTRFHKYLYGRSFTLQTDHKPLLGLFHEDRPIPPMASGRIQRWALTMANYEYQLQFKAGKKNCNADGMSRLPVPGAHCSSPQPAEVVLSMSVIDATPATAAKVAQWTSKDPSLSLVFKFVQEGWPAEVREDLQSFSRRRQELSSMDGCLLLGSRVIIPPPGREQLLQALHEGHPSITRMKALARSYIWWPSIDAEIELAVRSCDACQMVQKSASPSQLHPWEWPGKPWTRLHIDYAGPFEGKMLLVIVDSHSKYIDVHAVSSATSTSTIGKLRQTFATHGLPCSIVSDNGTAFTSQEFKLFCDVNGIKHICSSPFHPASNGLAERAVQTVKTGLKKQGGGDLDARLQRFLFQYRLTPQSTTGQSPFSLLMHRRPRSRFDLVFPDLSGKVAQKQAQAVDRRHTTTPEFFCGDAVWAVNFTAKPKWMAGVLHERLGPVTFTVRLTDGRLWKRHTYHLRLRLPTDLTSHQQ